VEDYFKCSNENSGYIKTNILTSRMTVSLSIATLLHGTNWWDTTRRSYTPKYVIFFRWPHITWHSSNNNLEQIINGIRSNLRLL